jgi:hypothetical protein
MKTASTQNAAPFSVIDIHSGPSASGASLILSLELLHIAFAGLRKALKRGEDSHRSRGRCAGHAGMVKIIFFTRVYRDRLIATW